MTSGEDVRAALAELAAVAELAQTAEATEVAATPGAELEVSSALAVEPTVTESAPVGDAFGTRADVTDVDTVRVERGGDFEISGTTAYWPATRSGSATSVETGADAGKPEPP